MRTLFLLAVLALPTTTWAAPPATTSKHIDIVLCLDTSGSMDGLLDSARRTLWTVINHAAKADNTPEIRVGLYSYGNNGLDPKKGWVRQEIELTTDLDSVYKQLVALRIASTNSKEYVARVCKTALNELKWSTERDALRLLFVCGNEAADQDVEVPLADVVELAKKKQVIVNAIYCGSPIHQDATGWKTFASDMGGKFASINQEEAALVVTPKTPFDEEIAKLSTKINETYVCYGPKGEAGAANQVAQDQNAAKVAPGVALERASTKAGRLYKNEEWDLVDRMLTQKDFDLKTIKEADLPEVLKKLKTDERLPYLKKKADERTAIQKQINELATKRQQYIEKEREKLPAQPAEKEFSSTLRKIVQSQAESKGIKIKDKP